MLLTQEQFQSTNRNNLELPQSLLTLKDFKLNRTSIEAHQDRFQEEPNNNQHSCQTN